MLCPAGQVIFIHSKTIDKTGPTTLIIASTSGELSEYLRGVIESVNPEVAPYHRKNE